MLTKKQYELLMFIHERVREAGVPPSFDEMKDALDLRSKSGIHRLITALEERGFIRRLEKRARALEIVRLPENMAEGVRPAATRAQAQRMTHGELLTHAAAAARPSRTPADTARAGTALCGAWGIRDDRRRVSMSRCSAASPPARPSRRCRTASATCRCRRIDLRSGEHYALEVTGDSMINAGILDGDTVIIQRSDSANTGDIVVALVDENEATLKRLRRRGDSIALEAANPAYETRLYGADRVRIQGRWSVLSAGIEPRPKAAFHGFPQPFPFSRRFHSTTRLLHRRAPAQSDQLRPADVGRSDATAPRSPAHRRARNRQSAHPPVMPAPPHRRLRLWRHSHRRRKHFPFVPPPYRAKSPSCRSHCPAV